MINCALQLEKCAEKLKCTQLQEMDDGTIDDAVSIKSIFLNLICGY